MDLEADQAAVKIIKEPNQQVIAVEERAQRTCLPLERAKMGALQTWKLGLKSICQNFW